MSAFRLVLIPACLLLLAGPALAEPVLLKSGKRLDARRVEVVEKGVKVTLSVTGGTARVTYPFARIDPAFLVPLLERHLIRGEDLLADAQAALLIAGIAFDAGMTAEAGSHFAQAAMLDPSLAGTRDEGLAKIRDIEAGAALAELEALLREGDPIAVLAFADGLYASALGPVLTPIEAMRVKTLAQIAEKLAAKLAVPEPADDESADQMPGAGPAGFDDLDPKTAALLEEVRAGTDKAFAAREAAADPDLSNPKARRHLEVAARALLDARRTLNQVELPVPDVVAEMADVVRDLLLATYLDVADLYREEADFEAARRWLRAASVLDPEHHRVAEVRDRIEQDMAAPYEAPPPWYGPVEAYTLYPGGILPYGCGSRGFGFGGLPRRYGGLHVRARYHRGHFHGALRFHGG